MLSRYCSPGNKLSFAPLGNKSVYFTVSNRAGGKGLHFKGVRCHQKCLFGCT